ncbi:MAG: hypothetical protein AB7I48_20770 [Planctomycetaceae bacterium]
MATFLMRSSGVPEGQYRARFARWETSVHEQYGDRCQFVWTVLGGQHDGSEASRYTGVKMTPKSAIAKLAKGLAGRPIEIGDTFDPDRYIGREYLILVAETESGSTRVESVMPVDAGVTATPLAAAQPVGGMSVPF